MREFFKRAFWAVVLLPITAGGSFFIGKILTDWGGLDAAAVFIATQLPRSLPKVSGTFLANASGSILFVISYGVALRLIWYRNARDRSKKLKLAGTDSQEALLQNPRHELPLDKPADNVIEELFNKKRRVGFGLEINPHALRVSVGDSGPYFSTNGSSLYQIKRTLNLKVENTDKQHAITRCKILIEKIDPPEYEGPWTLRDDISIGAGDHLFIPLVTYGEARDQAKYPCGDSFMILHVPEPSPKPSARVEQIVSLKATSLQTAPCEIRFKIWVDVEGRLRIAASPEPETIPRKEGSKIAHKTDDLLAIGPNLTASGAIVSVAVSLWTIRLKEFLIGDAHALINFIQNFDQLPPGDRYILVNEIGDGRLLTAAPSLTRDGDDYVLQCPVASSFPRIRAQELPADFAVSEANDLFAVKGRIATVSGVEALPQKIWMNLSHQKGESPFHRDFGTLFSEILERHRASPRLAQLLKLEAVRLAAIPYYDQVSNQQSTPFRCVERVWGIELLADSPTNRRLPICVDLDIKGLGRWKHEMRVFVPTK